MKEQSVSSRFVCRYSFSQLSIRNLGYLMPTTLISKILPILGSQPLTTKAFLTHNKILSHSSSEQFLKQNTISSLMYECLFVLPEGKTLWHWQPLAQSFAVRRSPASLRGCPASVSRPVGLVLLRDHYIQRSLLPH